MNKIVGIIGFAGSGKDTAGEYLINKKGYKRYSFAEPLKDAVSVIFGWERDLLEGSTLESRAWREQPDLWWEEKLNWRENNDNRFTPRVCLQYFGTNTIRHHFNDNIWLLCLENWLRKVTDQKIVITDCRFKNEISTLRSYDAKIIRIKRGSEPEWYSIAEEYNKSGDENLLKILKDAGIHESERDWIGQHFDAVIDNNSTLQDFYKKIDSNI